MYNIIYRTRTPRFGPKKFRIDLKTRIDWRKYSDYMLVICESITRSWLEVKSLLSDERRAMYKPATGLTSVWTGTAHVYPQERHIPPSE